MTSKSRYSWRNKMTSDGAYLEATMEAYRREAMKEPLPVRAVSALNLRQEPEEAAEVIRSVVTLVRRVVLHNGLLLHHNVPFPRRGRLSGASVLVLAHFQ